MANIVDLGDFNQRNRDLMKIKDINNDVILFTKQEAKEALISYINAELNLIKEVEDDVHGIVEKELIRLERKILRHIDDKITDLTEKIVEASLTRVIEAEINRRVDEKINKIKNGL
jgi:hypothetical protein